MASDLAPGPTPQRITVWQTMHGLPIYRASCNRCSWTPKINYDTLSQAASANRRHRERTASCRH